MKGCGYGTEEISAVNIRIHILNAEKLKNVFILLILAFYERVID